MQWFSRSGGLAQRVPAVGARTPQSPPPLQSRCAPRPSPTTATHPPSGGGARWRTPPGGDDCWCNRGCDDDAPRAQCTTTLCLQWTRRTVLLLPHNPFTAIYRAVPFLSLIRLSIRLLPSPLPPPSHPIFIHPHTVTPPRSAGNLVIDTLILSCSDVSLPSYFSLPSSPSPWATLP